MAAKRAIVTLSVFAALTVPIVALAEVPESPADIRYWTEQYPPYNYEAEGELQGLMIDVWETLWERMEVDLDRDDITLAPWARAYHEIQNWPATAVAVMTHTESREAYMRFVGPMVDVRFVLFARAADDVELDDLADIRDYDVATVRDDIAEQLLVDEGFDVDDFERRDDPAEAASMLEAGRVDLFAYQEDVAGFEMELQGMDLDAYEAAYVLDEGNLQIAFHQDMPDAIIDDYQRTLDAMRSDGTLEDIIADHVER